MRRLLPVAVLLLGGCRDGVAPFTVPEWRAESDPRQLTFGPGNERDPHWSADGDSVYFHATQWYHQPGPGTLLRISPEGGPAAPLATHAQPSAAAFLANPAVPAGGEPLAYLDVLGIRSASSCDVSATCAVPEPLLDTAVLRLRSPTATAPAFADPGLLVRYPGVDPEQWRGGAPPYHQRVLPFQREFLAGETGLLRASWSPDGTRLVFSDGSGLHLWTPGAATSTRIPATDDGVAPAWSPNGTWIAFAIVERGDSAIAQCRCAPRGETVHFRTWWPVVSWRLAVVRPDGSGLRLLGEGREPAWAPDSRSLYVRRGDAIVHVPLETPAGAAPVPGTERGGSPAVSPDGKWLAFTRRDPGSTGLDLWVKRLTP